MYEKETFILLLTALYIMATGLLYAQTTDLRMRTILEEVSNGEARATQTPYSATENTEATIIEAPPFNANSTLNRGPNGATRYQITLAFYSAPELAAAGFRNGGTINSLGFIYSSSNATARDSVNGNIKFYLLNSTDVSARVIRPTGQRQPHLPRWSMMDL